MSTRGFDGHQSEFDYIVLYYTLTVQLIDGLYNTVTKRWEVCHIDCNSHTYGGTHEFATFTNNFPM